MAKKAAKPAGTPALIALARAGITVAVHAYDHDPAETNFGEEAARELGVDPGRVFKTLVTLVDGTPTVAVVPVAGRLDLKALAHAVGGKKAELAPMDLAERKTGYVAGGISPIGQKTRLATVLESGAWELPTIFISGGRRGLDIEITAADLAAVTGAIPAPIARD
ncbi:Cys-tRNA(Pro) deacylase [Mycetocola spongiae]|uniref:Cys-tRNA(Pro) deacylase n=1 Tax=Mycetocola spongiae TaxID=2859226 RepID=UPI001CF42E8A|nr:Cys-tRNA(Pro) deacylase [Mycetocola spongiae]UCR88882.1 Cys-tRNA(Pro) deacylase [Mycetocola spongiae]